MKPTQSIYRAETELHTEQTGLGTVRLDFRSHWSNTAFGVLGVVWSYEDFQGLAVHPLNDCGIHGTGGLTN